jgi:orotidine-5'-phosphate decarboxylase
VKPAERIIVALDADDRAKALQIAAACAGRVGVFKVGKELFTAEGPAIVREIVQAGGRVFLDLKYHDIPNTVKGACRAAASLGAFMLNVHAAGGRKMIAAAREGLDAAGPKRPLLLAVTVLTSIDAATLRDEVRIPHSPLEQVVFWARMAAASGADGVVCAPTEIAAVRAVCGREFLIVTPGVRPAWAGADDQKRIMTPAEAVAAGADYLVIGRPITRAADMAAAAGRIADEIAGAGR